MSPVDEQSVEPLSDNFNIPKVAKFGVSSSNSRENSPSEESKTEAGFHLKNISPDYMSKNKFLERDVIEEEDSNS